MKKADYMIVGIALMLALVSFGVSALFCIDRQSSDCGDYR